MMGRCFGRDSQPLPGAPLEHRVSVDSCLQFRSLWLDKRL